MSTQLTVLLFDIAAFVSLVVTVLLTRWGGPFPTRSVRWFSAALSGVVALLMLSVSLWATGIWTLSALLWVAGALARPGR